MNAKRDALISLSLKALQSGTGASATAAQVVQKTKKAAEKERDRGKKEESRMESLPFSLTTSAFLYCFLSATVKRPTAPNRGPKPQ